MTNVLINWSAYAQYIVPFKLRGVRMVAWLTSLLAPLQTANAGFAAWAYAMRYNLTWNGQVIYLEHRLNDQFDASQRRIYIGDPVGAQVVPLYVYNKAEAQNNLIVRNKPEGNAPHLDNKVMIGVDDFVVHVPTSAMSPAIEVIMRAVINRYRIAGVTYSIQTF
jgi:hypothetical protein